jgi:DNA-binding transcriptional regulator YiaG
MTMLKQFRERAGLSTADVASALGIADSTVRNWDYGRTVPKLRADQFVRLLKLYQITPEQLLEAVERSIPLQSD